MLRRSSDGVVSVLNRRLDIVTPGRPSRTIQRTTTTTTEWVENKTENEILSELLASDL